MEKVPTFLIIDDDVEDHDIFKEAVYQINSSIKCTTVISCEDGLAYLKGHLNALPDYIFLDLNMPRMNGKQCLKVLKENASFKDIPVIIYTTSFHEKDKEETARLGAHHFITKPTSLMELKKEIENVLTLQVS